MALVSSQEFKVFGRGVKLFRSNVFGALACVGCFASTAAFACTSDEMLTTENGFVYKVVAGSDKILAFEDEAGTVEAFEMGLLQPYFVMCESGDFFKITDIPADTIDEAESGTVGFVPKEQVYSWPTREALSFSDIAFLEERTEIVAWNDEGVLDKYMETTNIALYPPAFKENLEATLGRERSTRPYPVLGSEEKLFRRKAPKRVYDVLLPAAIKPTDTIVMEKKDVAAAEDTLTSATILVVFDATASMESFALETVKAINNALDSIPREVRDGSSMGFLFYRDAEDAEKLVPVQPLPIAEASAALEKAAAFMKGGGDAQEPILDALYYAQNIYNWDQSGRKIIIGILNDDAKPTTIGRLDDKGRVPANLDAFEIGGQLREENISVITVQAGPNAGENLLTVLSTIAEKSKGAFVPYDAGGGASKAVAGKMVELMTVRAGEAIAKGENALTEIEYDLRGYATIPLETLDGEMLERLRAAGVNFNIDRGEGGVLVQQGFILENNDLLAPEIQIEKDTLLNLINLYSVLAVTGVDEESMLESISEAVAAIAGENYDANDSIEEIIQKKLGIEFRSDLLNFDVNYLPALVPAERLAISKRIQDAATILGQYLEANLVEFDSQPAVWMPVEVLP